MLLSICNFRCCFRWRWRCLRRPKGPGQDGPPAFLPVITLTSTHTAGPLEHSQSPEVISRNHSLSYLQLGCQVLTWLSLFLSKVIHVFFFSYVPLEQTYQTSRSTRLEKFLRNFNAGVRESLLCIFSCAIKSSIPNANCDQGKVEKIIRNCTVFSRCASRCEVHVTNDPCQGHVPDTSLFIGQ